MKTARKALMLILCAALLVSATVTGTLAYLAQKTNIVENTFTFGNVTLADQALDEAKVNEYGEPVEGAGRVTANTYKLIPGHSYTKDPTIHIKAGSEPCYVFVKVEDGLVAIQDAKTIATQMDELGWKAVPNATGVFYKEAAVDALNAEENVDVKVFESFKLKPDAVVADYADAKITIQAYVVQAADFTGALDAWAKAPCTWGE